MTFTPPHLLLFRCFPRTSEEWVDERNNEIAVLATFLHRGK